MDKNIPGKHTWQYDLPPPPPPQYPCNLQIRSWSLKLTSEGTAQQWRLWPVNTDEGRLHNLWQKADMQVYATDRVVAKQTNGQ